MLLSHQIRRETSMPVLFNYDTIDPISLEDGVTKQPLITPERVKSDCILLDRYVLNATATMKIDVSSSDLAWFQLLDGSAVLDGTAGIHDLTVSNVVFLPPGFKGSLSTSKGATVLYGGVPNASRFDENFGDSLDNNFIFPNPARYTFSRLATCADTSLRSSFESPYSR